MTAFAPVLGEQTDVNPRPEPHPCGHRDVVRHCGGCDPGAGLVIHDGRIELACMSRLSVGSHREPTNDDWCLLDRDHVVRGVPHQSVCGRYPDTPTSGALAGRPSGYRSWGFSFAERKRYMRAAGIPYPYP